MSDPVKSGQMKGVFFSSDLPDMCEVRTFPIPTPGKGEVLIKNIAVASNPKDWMVPEIVPGYASIEGSDLAGLIESVGEGVTEFEKGDRIAAFTKMMSGIQYGAYAEYTVAPASSTFHIAEHVSFQEAATFPLCVMTAVIGLFIDLKLPELSGKPYSDDRKRQAIIVNGASSAVGGFVVQLGKIAGYTVIGIAVQGGDYAKTIGADRLIDYRGRSDEEVAGLVKTALHELGSERVAVYDAIATPETANMLANHVMQPEGGKITVLNPVLVDDPSKPDNIQATRTFVGLAHADHEEFATRWYRQVGKWVDEGVIKPTPVQLLPNGLGSVAEGMHLLKSKKISAKKLVYNVSDTEGLVK